MPQNDTYFARLGVPTVVQGGVDDWKTACNLQPQIEPLRRRLGGRIRVPGTTAGPLTMSLILDSGSRVTAVSESLCPRPGQHCPGMELTETHPGG